MCFVALLFSVEHLNLWWLNFYEIFGIPSPINSDTQITERMVSINKSLNKVGSCEPLNSTFNLQKIAQTNFNSLLPQ